MAQDGRQLRWDKHNQARRQQILDAALEVIELGAPGDEYHVQQIAERAGLNRTVVYRHFADRADLDLAIRTHVMDGFTEQLAPAVTIDGTINEIIRRIVSTYVDWTVSHPALHAVAAQEGSGAFQHGIDRIAAMLTDILELAIAMLGVDLDENEEALVDPLSYGLVGAVHGTVRRWVAREPREPSASSLSELLSMSVWNLLDGHARRLGLNLDPDIPLVDLLKLPAELSGGLPGGLQSERPVESAP